MFRFHIYRLPILTFTHLGFILYSASMTAPSLLVGFTSLQLMCGSVEGMVFSWLRGTYGTSSFSAILVLT